VWEQRGASEWPEVTYACRYITYGEEEWRERTEKALEGMELYDITVRHAFQHTLGWLNQWACSRSFGLGTRMPWDPQYLIESLSDSTIYMAYYMVAHVLQGGDMFGKQEGPVKAEALTHVRPFHGSPLSPQWRVMASYSRSTHTNLHVPH
jgi:leucyl-tRNA synthetase